MKKNILMSFGKFAMGAALASMALTSCNDWLNLEPENAVTADRYWKSEADVASAMTGIYCSWMSSMPTMWLHGEMRADMIMPGSTTNGNYTLVREGNITSSNSLVNWASYYSTINKCNLLLERSQMALAADPSYTVRQDNIYKAQARVVRALMYFYLIRVWKDVPYMTEAFYDDTKDRMPEVSDQMTILKAIIADLEEVQKEGALPYTYSAQATDIAKNKGQVTMYMLKALLADMYRMLGSYETDPSASQVAYQSSLKLCNEIIGSGQYALVPFNKQDAFESGYDLADCNTPADSAFYVLLDVAPDKWFNDVYVEGNSSESIMELQEDSYNSSGFYGQVVGTRYYTANVDNLQNSLFPSTEKEVAAAFRYRDVRLGMNFGIYQGNTYIWKFGGRSLSSDPYLNVTDFKRNISVYRLAEIYLMKAEVLCQIAMANGNDQQMLLDAYRALFQVRDRASAVEMTDLELGTGERMQDKYWNELRNGEDIVLADNEISATALEKVILDEEARELAFEGRRWFDLLRNAERNQEGKGSCTGGSISYLVSIASSCTETDKASYIMGQFRKPDFRYLPYPYQDVSLNDNLSQKPFWGVE